ncbi:hypothetical protein Tco_0144766 [Tanacetum coccineum]
MLRALRSFFFRIFCSAVIAPRTMIEDFDNVAFGQIVTMTSFGAVPNYEAKRTVSESISLLRESSDFSEESGSKEMVGTANESGFEVIHVLHSFYVVFFQPCFASLNSEEFVNVFMRIGFGSTIELVSLTRVKWLLDSKFVCGFGNSDCGTRCRSDNMVSSPHGFIIHWKKIFKSN